MGTGQPNLDNDVLNSWKEIAVYLDRGVRTVQRWERELNLPVRRPRARGRSPVIAMRSELDLWLHCCPAVKCEAKAENGNPSLRLPALVASRELQLASQQLRGELVRSRVQLREAIYDLHVTLQKIIVVPPRNPTPKAG